MLREYIVTVEDPSVWDTLWGELLTDGQGGPVVPRRAVDVVNERPFNDFSAHFLLTEAEALLLEKYPRIVAVDQQADSQEDVFKICGNVRYGNYNRHESSTTAVMKNWGLLRCTSLTNQFGTSTSISTNCPYNLDGSNVDIIVVDTGVEPNHPEFAVNADGTGGSRVVDFDWSTLGVPGIASASSIGGYLGDSDGHGSNCASIAAGNTCGWAPKAAIYSIRIFSGNDIQTNAPLGAIDSDYAFDLARAFHLQKIATGNTRPTVCTNSWSYNTTYSGMQSTTWRGTVYTNTTPSVEYGQVTASHPYNIAYVDASVNNCAAAGVIVLGAAGNTSHKIDIPGGTDYDNSYVYKSPSTGSLYTIYYHRGASPCTASSMIMVGAHGYINSTLEGKASFSSSGPRVDLYAPGVMIMGAYGNSSYVTNAVADPRAAGYFLNKISGTSQATPQVAGYIACLLQARPKMTPSQVKAFLIDHSAKNILDEATWAFPVGTTYGNNYLLQGGPNRLLYQPFNNSTRGTMTS